MPLSSVPDVQRATPPSHSMISGAGSVVVAVVRSRLLHLQQELVVALRLPHAVEQQLERLLGLQGVEDPPEPPDDLELVRRQQELLLAGSGGVDVDRREDPLVRELAVELELHVAGALELLEDDLVHPRAGLDQRRREDRQRSAVLDVARSTEEPLRRIERRGSTPPERMRPLAGAA